MASIVKARDLDIRPHVLTSGVPGFTGHLPGFYAENLHGHPYGTITAQRQEMVDEQRTGQIPNSKYRSDFKSTAINSQDPPSPYALQHFAVTKRRGDSGYLPSLPTGNFHTTIGTARNSSTAGGGATAGGGGLGATSAPTTVGGTLAGGSSVGLNGIMNSARRVHDGEPKTLADTNPLCKMPGYTGHIPCAQIEDNLGVSYARSTKQGYLSSRRLLTAPQKTPAPPTDENNTNNNRLAQNTTNNVNNVSSKRPGNVPQLALSQVKNNSNNNPEGTSAASTARKLVHIEQQEEEKNGPVNSGAVVQKVALPGDPAPRNIHTPIVGYAGFIPCFKDTDASMQYRTGLGSARKMQSDGGDPDVVVHVGFTPSMREFTYTPRPPTTARASTATTTAAPTTTTIGNGMIPRTALNTTGTTGTVGGSSTERILREDVTSQPARKSGYTGFRPMPPKTPDVYPLPKPGEKIGGANGLYFGDLTQYWNDKPYTTTYSDATSNMSHIKPRLTPRRW